MKKRLCALALVFAALTSAAMRAESLVIATYNVANYTLAGRIVENAYMRGYPKTEDEKAALRTVIKAINADVIALQEMGARPFLAELQRDLKSEGVDYPHGEVLDAADPERHVAVLSKKPFAAVNKHADLEISYFGKNDAVKRGLLEIRMATDAGDLTLFIVHLKSRLTDRSDDPESAIRRLAEAEAVRNRILKIFPRPSVPDARFMILGDCNDSVINRPVQTLARRGKIDIAAPLPGGDSRGEVWTHFYAKQGSYSRVDHILVSPPLMPSVAGGSVTIYDGQGVREASDHRPVIVRLEMKK